MDSSASQELQKDMKKNMKEEIFHFSEFSMGFICGVAALALFLTFFNSNPRQIEEKMEKQAISHNAAHYEVDTNGVVSFKWNK